MTDSETPPWSSGPDSLWETYWRLAKPHRETVTELLLETLAASGKSPTLCLWGVGSCHDVDLQELLGACSKLTMVDLNRQNVLHGLRYQLGETPDNVSVLAPYDLAGLPPAGGAAVAHEALLSAISGHTLPGHGRHSVIASLGMLSQIVLDVVALHGLGTGPGNGDAPAEERWSNDHQVGTSFTVTRRRHLALMAEHLESGGHGVAVIDFVNSHDAPEIADADDFEGAVERAVRSLPAAPALLPQHLHTDLLRRPGIARHVTDVMVSRYWLWRMPNMSFACYATRFRKR